MPITRALTQFGKRPCNDQESGSSRGLSGEQRFPIASACSILIYLLVGKFGRRDILLPNARPITVVTSSYGMISPLQV